MKILTAVKRVLDFNIKVRLKEDGTNVDLASAKMAMNPFDEIAVEEAVRLKEAGIADEVIAVSLGTKSCQETLRSALAMGADRAILVECNAELQPLAVAKLLAAIAQREEPDLIILGKQAIDDDACQTGQMVAALLDWPQATFASRLEISGTCAIVEREIDGGRETLQMPLPCLVTTDLRLNEPRYVTLPNIMKAKTKPLAVVSSDSFGIDTHPRIKTLRVDEPPKRKAGIRVADASELIIRLQQEAKVI